MSTNHFTVYADGSSGAGGGKPIGWGYVVVHDDKVLTAGKGGHVSGTNGIAELMAAREGLRALVFHPTFLETPSPTIELVSDSQVTLGLANGSMSPSKNVALATHVREICVRYSVHTRWVKGHNGEPGNEMADALAGIGKKEAKCLLGQ